MPAPAVKTTKMDMLPIDQVRLDTGNPRIRKFLEMYPGEPTALQIHMALGAATDNASDTSTSFEKLKNSIRTNGGIIQPIIVNRRPDGTFQCVEGNTRLALYQTFHDDKVPGDWSHIPALIHEDMDAKLIDAIRLQIHLVGTRAWDPYSKAKYLHQLRNEHKLSFAEIVDFCGGKKKEVIQSINAFEDMEKYYREVIPDDTVFDTTRFSGFVELQKPGIKQAITEAGFTLLDFSKWIHEGKLYPLYTVRSLPAILKSKKATEVLIKQGAKKAKEALDKPELSKTLMEANLGQLAHALAQRVYKLPFKEAEEIRDNPGADPAPWLYEAHEQLSDLFYPKTEDGE